MTELEIRNLKADDESLYKCELTYLEVRDNCAVIQFVNLTTLGKLGALTPARRRCYFYELCVQGRRREVLTEEGTDSDIKIHLLQNLVSPRISAT